MTQKQTQQTAFYIVHTFWPKPIIPTPTPPLLYMQDENACSQQDYNNYYNYQRKQKTSYNYTLHGGANDRGSHAGI